MKAEITTAEVPPHRHKRPRRPHDAPPATSSPSASSSSSSSRSLTSAPPPPSSTLTLRQQHDRLISAYREHRLAISSTAAASSSSASPASAPPPRPLPISDTELVLATYRFLPPTSSSPSSSSPSTSLQRMAARYYAQLYKEYVIADLRQAKRGNVGLRWRTEREVIAGKGHVVCGSVDCQREGEEVRTWRVLFCYEEREEDGSVSSREVSVKLRLCADCAVLLHWEKIAEVKRHMKEMRRQEKESRKKQRRSRDSSSRQREEQRIKAEPEEAEDDSAASLLPPPLERPPSNEWAALFP